VVYEVVDSLRARVVYEADFVSHVVCTVFEAGGVVDLGEEN